MLACSVLFVLGVVFTHGSGAFIAALPVCYYVLERTGLTGTPTRMQVGFALAGLATCLTLCFPPVRSVMASYYLKEAKKASNCGATQRAREYTVLAARWQPQQSGIHGMGPENSVKTIPAAARIYGSTGRENTDRLYSQARQASKEGDEERAVSLYKQILQADPRHPEANYCLAMHYDQKLHDRDNAIRHLTVARDSLPEGNVWRQRCQELLTQLGGRSR